MCRDHFHQVAYQRQLPSSIAAHMQQSRPRQSLQRGNQPRRILGGTDDALEPFRQFCVPFLRRDASRRLPVLVHRQDVRASISQQNSPIHVTLAARTVRVRVQLIGHFEACMTEIYLHIGARMADCMDTHP